jgi:polar amino acid transport system permease protein
MLAYGIWNTLLLALSSTILGVAVGMLLALMGVSRRRPVRLLARVYTDVFRGLPAILTILVIGTGLAPLLLPITGGNPYPLGILALGLIASAYIGEIFRAGILAIDTGQMEASRALGLTHHQGLYLVVVPQAARQVLPSLVNQFIAIVKDSSLVYFLGLVMNQRELFRVGQDAAVTSGNLSPLVLAGAFYLIITVPLTHFVNWVDDRVRSGKRPPAAAAPADEPAAADAGPAVTGHTHKIEVGPA